MQTKRLTFYYCMFVWWSNAPYNDSSVQTSTGYLFWIWWPGHTVYTCKMEAPILFMRQLKYKKTRYKIIESQLKTTLYYISYRLSNCKVNNKIKIHNIVAVLDLRYSLYLHWIRALCIKWLFCSHHLLPSTLHQVKMNSL